jgi:hypothetical protein
MKILAIDPGNEQSAYMCFYDNKLVEFAIMPNEKLLNIIPQFTADEMAIEMIASYGMAVGKTVFETCVWIGRFVQRFQESHNRPFHFVYRKDVKIHLCHSMRAKDSNIRQAIIDRYPATGEGKTPQIGTKNQPGPLYGVSKDIWSALAVAIYFTETKKLMGA